MSQFSSRSPFQNNPPEIDAPDVAPLSERRLKTPAERFRAGEIARNLESDAPESSFDALPDIVPIEEYQEGYEDDHADAELEPPRDDRPDPFQPLPRDANDSSAPARNRRGAQTRRARREVEQHSPHYHEKKPHTVAHTPIHPASGGEAQPQNEWDKAAQNSMARAALARKRARMRKFVGRIFLAGALGLIGWGAVTALTAPQFEITKVEVSGMSATPRKSVEQLAQQLIGKNIFRAPRAQVESAIAAIPTVQSVSIERAWTWPPHMRAAIVERQPILQVGSGTTWWVADAQGVAFRRANRDDSALEMLTSQQFVPQTGKPLPADKWKRARELAGALNADNALAAKEKGVANGEKYWSLRRVYLDKDGAAALRIGDSGNLKAHSEMLIRLGEEGWPAKLKQARMALAFFDRTGRKARELDLVSSEHPRWSPKPQPEISDAKPLGTVDGEPASEDLPATTRN